MHQNQNEGLPTSSTPNKTLPVTFEHSSPAQPPQIVLESGKKPVCTCDLTCRIFFFLYMDNLMEKVSEQGPVIIYSVDFWKFSTEVILCFLKIHSIVIYVLKY